MPVEITDGLTPMIEELQRDLPDAINRGLLEAAQHAEYHIRRTLHDEYKGGFGRTGRLANDFQATVAMYQGKPAGTAVSDLIYARIQDLGGVITPRTAKALRFQVDKNVWRTAQRVVIQPKNYTRKAHARAEPGIAEIIDRTLQGAIDEADDG